MANDKDLKIGISAQVDEAGFSKGEDALENVGKSGETAMETVEKEAKEASKAVDELAEKAATVPTGGVDMRTGKAEYDAKRLAERQAEAERAEASRKAIEAKRAEAAATKELSEAEKALEEATEKRIEQGKKDVELAKEKKAAREEKTAQDSGSDLAALARGASYFAAITASIGAADAVLKEFQDGLVSAGVDLDKLRETNPADFLWVDAISAVANPLETLKTKLMEIGGLDDLRKSAEQAAELEKGIAKATAEAAKFAAVDNSIRLANLNAELTAVDAITAALRRKIQVERSARSLEETVAGIADQNAIDGGADPNVVKAQAAARQAAAEIEALTEDIAVANQAIEKARAQQGINESELLEMMSQFGADSPEVMKAQDALISAKNQVDNLTLDAEALESVVANKNAEIIAKTEAAISTAGDGVETAAAARAQAVLDQVAGSGSQLNELQQAMKSRVETILADGKVSASEQVALQQSLSQLITSWGAEARGTQALLKDTNAFVSELMGGLVTLKQQQAQLRRDFGNQMEQGR